MDWKTKKLEDGREYHKSEMGRYRSTVYDRKGKPIPADFKNRKDVYYDIYDTESNKFLVISRGAADSQQAKREAEGWISGRPVRAGALFVVGVIALALVLLVFFVTY